MAKNTRPTGAKQAERGSNEQCPRYVAFAAGDSYVESDDDLDTLIALVVELARGNDEDIVIWRHYSGTARCAAVLLSSGEVFRYESHVLPMVSATADTATATTRKVRVEAVSPSGQLFSCFVTLAYLVGESEESIRSRAVATYHATYGTSCRVCHVVIQYRN